MVNEKKRGTMKAITIKQPFATLIVDGVKDVENRSWVLPNKYIGERVLIHASKSKDIFKPKHFLDHDQILHLCDLGYENKKKTAENFPLGAILGSVVITGCVTDSESVWAMPDHFHFTLAHAVRFPQPIPATGKLGFWEYDAIKAEPEEAVHDHKCSHEFVSREYILQPYGTCMSCGITVFDK